MHAALYHISVAFDESAGLLQPTIGIQQFRANPAGSQLIFQDRNQRLQPVRCNKCIVIEKDEISSTRCFDTNVVSFTEIAIYWKHNELEFRIQSGQFLGFCMIAAVIDNDDLVSTAGCICNYVIETHRVLDHLY